MYCNAAALKKDTPAVKADCIKYAEKEMKLFKGWEWKIKIQSARKLSAHSKTAPGTLATSAAGKVFIFADLLAASSPHWSPRAKIKSCRLDWEKDGLRTIP